VLALTPGTLFLIAFIWRCSANSYGARRFTLFDDAMISMTYGRTLAAAGELVWFPGAARVQGITNPLWTLYMAALHLVGFEGSSAALAVSLTSACLLLGTALAIGDLAERCLAPRRAAKLVPLLAAGAVPFAYPLTYWSLRGMEVGVLAFALVILVRSLANVWGRTVRTEQAPGRAASIGVAATVCAAGVATRLDFAPLALVVVACAAWWAPDRVTRARVVGVVGGTTLASVAAVIGAQRWYYGEALPNTYRLKVEGFTVAERLERGTMVLGKLAPLAALTVLAVAVTVIAGSVLARRTCVVAALLLFTAAAYSTWVGGDAWEANLLLNRYVSVALPMAILVGTVAVGVAIDRVSNPSRRQVAVVATLLLGTAGAVGLVTNPFGYEAAPAVTTAAILAALVAVTAVVGAKNSGSHFARTATTALAAVMLLGTIGGGPLVSWLGRGAAYSEVDQMQSEYGLAMRRLTGADEVIGTVWAGAPAYYAERPMIDFLGKSDPVIADVEPRGPLHPGHNKWDHDYSIGELLPRVAIQIWATDLAALQMIGTNGYNFRCFALGTEIGGAYFRLGAGIREDELTICDGLPD